MSTIDDLKAKVQSLSEKLRAAEKELHAAMIAGHPVKLGDIGTSGGIEVIVSNIAVQYGKVRLYGRKKTKAGWHSVQSELYRGFEPKKGGNA